MSTATQVPAAAAPKRRRGRENVRDMVLSMLACIAIVVPIWYLAQPPASDSRAIRPVDPAGDVQAFSRVAPGIPVPSAVPSGWTATSSTLEGTSLRIGYVVPGDGYVEYTARAGSDPAFVTDQTGRGTPGSTLRVGGRSFRVYSGAGGATSLVLRDGTGTVVLGGLRETADDALITLLAGTLTTPKG